MENTGYPKIKNALFRLAYLLSQTTCSELGEAAIDVVAFYGVDDQKFLTQSVAVLEQICQHNNILPKATYLLAVATLEQAKHKLSA